jgi:type IV secretion system protein VirB9
MMRALLLGLALTAGTAHAELTPAPGPADPHIQSVPYDANQVVRLRTAPGYALTIEFSPDERIETVAMGATAHWHVTANKRADHLFVKQEQGAVDTNLTVITDARRYVFALVPGYGPDPTLPYTLRFTYAGVDSAPEVTVVRPSGSFRFSGSKALRPVEMADDGEATWIRWASDLDLPAVYSVDAAGRESIVNGAMRDGRFVVDAVAPRFVFRSGRHRTLAVRREARER